MKKIITLLLSTFASLTVFGQVSEISTLAGNDFTYDGATLHHYGVGFHNYLDEQDGVNLYGSGYFGIDLFTGGVNRFRISRYGNVGIGTTTPKAKLDIRVDELTQGTPVVSQYWSTPNADNYLRLETKWSEGINFDFIQQCGPNTYNSLSFYQGNIGVGTTKPLAQLDVQLKSLVQNVRQVSQYWSNGGNSGYNLRLETAWNGNDGINYYFVQKCGNNDFNSLSFFQGNVGVGTTIPQAQLDVQLKSLVQNVRQVSQYWSNGGNSGYNLRLETAWNGNDGINYYFVQKCGSTDFNSLSFFQGNVGIGTTTPAYKLDVLGTIRAKEIIVDEKGRADFVFAPSYNLKPLAEVEAFVKENKHLPEIPSAAEVAEKGVNLGEMQNKLLQKVEELTLYAIELEKSRNELVISQNKLEIARNEEIKKRVELEARLAKIETLLLQK